MGFGVNHVPGPGLPPTDDASLAALLVRHGAVVGGLFEAFLAGLAPGAAFPLDTGRVFRIAGGA